MLVTRELLEAIRGPDYLANLLRIAGTTAAQEARLQYAIGSGESLIGQYLQPIPDPAHPHFSIVQTIAVAEAMYELEHTSGTGSSEAEIDRMKQRRKDLEAIRDGRQTGARISDGPASSILVGATDPWAQRRLRGFR